MGSLPKVSTPKAFLTVLMAPTLTREHISVAFSVTYLTPWIHTTPRVLDPWARFSQHHYQSSVCQDANGPAAQIPTFMDKSTIRLNISEFDAGIRATYAHGLNYILGETNSISCHGAPGEYLFSFRPTGHIPYSGNCLRAIFRT
jgi:hypothetical protein